jgi:putative transposase
MRFVFIRAEKANYSVVTMCRVLCVSSTGYYAWLKRKTPVRDRNRDDLARKVTKVYDDSKGRYGSPRVFRKLRNAGVMVSEKTVAKIMRNNGQKARTKRRYKATTDSKNTKRIAPNLLQRKFTVDAPNKVWVTDVTAVRTRLGWVYLAAILDLFSRRVVGWAMSDTNDAALAVAALDRAVLLRKPPRGLIHHSDRGSPYGSDEYIKALKPIRAIRSMSRKGDCWDNAVPESFFSSLEFECRGVHEFANLDDAQHVIGDYIDGFYNLERLHSTIGYRSPIEFEISSSLSRKAA